MHAHLLDRKVTSSASVSEAFIDTLRFSHGLVSADNILGCELLRGFVRNSLKLLILHFACDGLLGILWQRIVLILEQLCLNWLNRVVDSVTDKTKVSLC